MAASERHDVVVIGGGVGGMVAAAELVKQGLEPLVLESTERLGGRFSTIEQGGYRIPTGAIAIETGGPLIQTVEELGIDPDLRIPKPPVRVKVRGRVLTAGAPAWEHMIKRVTKKAGKLAEGLRRGGDDDVEEMSIAEWARRYTRSKTVLSLFQSLAASMFTVNAEELPARVFFKNLRDTGGYKTFGFAPRGNVEIANAMADALRQRGATIRTGVSAEAIEVEDGRAVAVRAKDSEGTEHRFETDGVVSAIGPRNTARLVAGTPAEADFRRRVEGTQPTSMLAISFSTEQDILPDCPGMINFTDTRRLCSLGNLTALCPELAPEGRTLYDAYSVPRPSVGAEYDEQAERELLEQDLADQVPGFEQAEIVHFKAMRGDMHPAQQSAPGNEPDVRTPLSNVVDAGDGVKPDGWIGTSGAARAAILAVESLMEDERVGTRTGAVNA